MWWRDLLWCSSRWSGCSGHLTLRRYSSAVRASASKSGSPGATGRDWRMPNSLQREADASASSMDQSHPCRMLLSLAMAHPRSLSVVSPSWSLLVISVNPTPCSSSCCSGCSASLASAICELSVDKSSLNRSLGHWERKKVAETHINTFKQRLSDPAVGTHSRLSNSCRTATGTAQSLLHRRFTTMPLGCCHFWPALVPLPPPGLQTLI